MSEPILLLLPEQTRHQRMIIAAQKVQCSSPAWLSGETGSAISHNCQYGADEQIVLP
jgi:hypothetical protein